MRPCHFLRSGYAFLAAGLFLTEPCHAAPEPGRAECDAIVARARARLSHLPAGSIARDFAESDLVQAKSEAGNGEFDDCVEFAHTALQETLHPQHSTQPKPAPPR